jgi:hypothetical protein
MEAGRLFRIAYQVAKQNQLRYIPYPKKPFNTENKKIFFKEIESFFLYSHYNYLNKNYKLVKDIDFKYIDDIFKK